MLTRIRPRPLLELARRDLPAPVDVINLIETASFGHYRWYGLAVLPALKAVGGRVRWMGRFEQSVHGERQADKLLIVRYPSHRHFLAMTLNPYYLAINLLRQAGVRRFEASFTHASDSDLGLARRETLVAVHFNSPVDADALAAVTELVAPVTGDLVYATRAVASLGFLDPPVATDPNPLTFEQLAMFAPGAEELDEIALAGVGGELDRLTDGCSVQIYRRESARVYRPSILPGGRPASPQAA